MIAEALAGGVAGGLASGGVGAAFNKFFGGSKPKSNEDNMFSQIRNQASDNFVSGLGSALGGAGVDLTKKLFGLGPKGTDWKDIKKGMDTLFPGTSPWERLSGAGGSVGGVGSAGISAKQAERSASRLFAMELKRANLESRKLQYEGDYQKIQAQRANDMIDAEIKQKLSTPFWNSGFWPRMKDNVEGTFIGDIMRKIGSFMGKGFDGYSQVGQYLKGGRSDEEINAIHERYKKYRDSKMNSGSPVRLAPIYVTPGQRLEEQTGLPVNAPLQGR